jgi:hypothetical protein
VVLLVRAELEGVVHFHAAPEAAYVGVFGLCVVQDTFRVLADVVVEVCTSMLDR